MIYLIRGDSETFICSGDIDLTGYKIRCEFYDSDDNKIRKATANVTGGSDDQILIDVVDTNIFNIFLLNDETNNLSENSFFEIEIESPTGNKLTVHSEKIWIKESRINWNDTTDV